MPLIYTDPEDGMIWDSNILNKEDLPAPFEPNNTKHSPSVMLKDVSFRA